MIRTLDINLLWHAQAQFAGYLWAEAEGLGQESGIALRNIPLDFELGPVKAVLSGTAAFGVASPAHLLESDRPDELRLLLCIQQESPLVYPVRTGSGIERPRDLKGHKVAVWPGGEDLELRWFLMRAGLPPDEVERVPTGDTVSPFIEGKVASAQVTVYHELHQIEAAGFDRDKLLLLRASDFEASLLKDGLFTTRRMVEEEPELVQSVVNSVLAGWKAAFDRPRHAVEICLELGEGLDRDDQTRQLEEIRKLCFCGATLTHGLGFPDPRHVKRAAEALSDLNEHSLIADPLTILSDKFWGNAPAALKVTA